MSFSKRVSVKIKTFWILSLKTRVTYGILKKGFEGSQTTFTIEKNKNQHLYIT